VEVANDLAQQPRRQLSHIKVEEPLRQRGRGVIERIGSRHISDDSRFDLSSLQRYRYNAGFVVAADW
jgi:hypothetical protein